jgi:hypothetical protein
MTGSFGSVRPPHRRLSLLLLMAGALLCGRAWPIGQLTQEELGRLLKVIDKHGSRAVIPHNVAAILQLKPGQATPDVKEAAYLDEAGNRHGFAPLNDGSGFFMFSSGTSLGQVVYVVDSDLRLVHAAQSLLKNGPLITLPEAEAQRSLDEEFRQWSKVLSPEGPAAAPFPFKGSGPTKGQDMAPQPHPFKQPEPKESAASKP